MKNNRSILLFIAAFLLIIYTVPVVQTGYEIATNQAHRIQMGDLVTDCFVTPFTKAKEDARLLDSLANDLEKLASRLQNEHADSGSSPDFGAAIDATDEALIKVKQLKQHVFDYNRHIAGDKNRFLGADTVKPYFTGLHDMQIKLEALLDNLTGEVTGVNYAGATQQLVAELHHVKGAFGFKGSAGDYAKLTLTALRRIMVGADYLRPYEKEMEKSSVFANTIRPVMQFYSYLAFNDLGDKGIPGKCEWFFYRPDVEYLTKPDIYDKRCREVDPNDAAITESAIDSIVAFKNQLAARGIELLVAIMPGKPSIYPDLLASGKNALPPGGFSHSLVLNKKLEAAGVNTADLFSAFAKERQQDSVFGDSIYLRTDTHFKGRAIPLTAKVIADRIRHYSWFTPGETEYAADTLTVMRSGDIAEMTKLSALKFRMLGTSFPAEAATCYQVYKIERDEGGAVVDKTLYRDSFKGSEILVLGDSFSRIYQTDEPKSAGWIAHLAMELRQPVASLVNDGGASTLVRQMLSRKPALLKGKKLVVWEIVERDFRFGAEGWKNVALPE